MKQLLIVLLVLVAIVGWDQPLKAADAPFPVKGEWHFCSGITCIILHVEDTVVDGSGNLQCADVNIKHLGPNLAVVECHSAGEGMLQYYFLFESENTASVWLITSNQRHSLRAGVYGLAQRSPVGAIPAELRGRWYVSHWTPVQPGIDTTTMELQENVVRITNPRRSTDCRAIPQVSLPGGEGEHNIEVSCGAGYTMVLRLHRISEKEFVASSGGGVDLLHREERPPSWFVAELMKSCDAITDQTSREECYSSRSLCEMVTESERSPLCIALVRQKKRDLAAAEVKNHLGAIAAGETAYFAEWNRWVGKQDFTPVADRSGKNAPVKWFNNTRFSILGFAPEGDVQCSYSLEGSEFPTKEEGFSAKAQCDLDANGKVSSWSITNRNRRIEHSGDDF